jgi:tRNA A-37 threonylcarbamoyl transferase component Bud32
MENISQKSSKSIVGKATVGKDAVKKSFMEFQTENMFINKSMYKLKSKKKPNYDHVKSRVYDFRNNDLNTNSKQLLNKSFCDKKKNASQPPSKSTKKPGVNSYHNLIEKTANKRTSRTPDINNSMMKRKLNEESATKVLSPIQKQENSTFQGQKNPFSMLSAKRNEKKNEILLKDQKLADQLQPKAWDVIMEDDVASSDTENKELNELMSKMNIDQQTSQFNIHPSHKGDVEMMDEHEPADAPQASEYNEEDWVDIQQNSLEEGENKENRQTNKLLEDCIQRLTEAGEALLSKEKAKTEKSEHPCLKSSLRPNTSHQDHLDTNKKSVTIITPNRAGVLQHMDIEQYEEYCEKSNVKMFDPSEWNIDRFEIGMPLSRGKFGHVLLVRERVSKYLFVLKMMFKSQLKKNPKYLRNFRREIEIHSKLNHENIVKMHGWFTDKKRLFIILEYCPEGELFSFLQEQKGKWFPEPIVSDYIRQMINALIYLHSKNIIHRDIKPENILVDNGTLKLADFGWSIHTPNKRRKTFWGTLDYLPPEMLRNDEYDESVDIWSIGVLTYELWSGYAPFQDKDTTGVYKKIGSTSYKMFKHFSEEVKDFIMRLLKKKPEERMTLKEALEHPFITKHLKNKDEMMIE